MSAIGSQHRFTKLISVFRNHLWIYALLLITTSCHKARQVNLSFYYWKTTYQQQPTENSYLKVLHCNKLYMRIMDVDLNTAGNNLTPVSPITFQSPLADSITLVPVVFIVNKALISETHPQLDALAGKIFNFVQGKITQAGKSGYPELQIDCDWTRTTRDNYFYLLARIKALPALKGKLLSATLRLHQLKNQRSNGVPPVDRVMLMCYNMGNLHQYGVQNSILEQTELEKYAGRNLSAYTRPVDIGLPLFSWAVAFRKREYIGISKRVNLQLLHNPSLFTNTDNNLFQLKTDLPSYGLQRGDEIRWESVSVDNLQRAAHYLVRYMNDTDFTNIIYFHLDAPTLTHYNYETLEKTAALFR